MRINVYPFLIFFEIKATASIRLGKLGIGAFVLALYILSSLGKGYSRSLSRTRLAKPSLFHSHSQGIRERGTNEIERGERNRRWSSCRMPYRVVRRASYRKGQRRNRSTTSRNISVASVAPHTRRCFPFETRVKITSTYYTHVQCAQCTPVYSGLSCKHRPSLTRSHCRASLSPLQSASVDYSR